MPTVISLRAAELRLDLRPDLGACIAGFWRGDEAVLRSTDAATLAAPGASGLFPLVPYSNRIGFGRLAWQGRVHTLRLNHPGSPHPMHGVAWQRPWQVLAQDAARAELLLDHAADADWPFDFRLRQTVVLSPQGLRLSLAFTNTAEAAQPVGLGWHPYFPQRDHSALQIDVATRWDMGADQLPTQAVPQPGGIHGPVAQLAFDHCFGGWDGRALIEDERLSLRLTSSLPQVVVYTPNGRGFYCVEPVSHVNNALQSAVPAAQGIRTLAPGESFEAWMALDVAGR